MTSAPTANSWVSSWPARSPSLLSSVTGAYVGIAVTYFEHGRGGKTFEVGAFTEVVAGDDILAHVEVRVVVRRETGGVAGLQPPPLVLGRLAGAKASLVVDVACLFWSARRWRESGGSEPYADGGGAQMGACWAGSPNVHAFERLERGKMAYRRLSSFLIVSTLMNAEEVPSVRQRDISPINESISSLPEGP